MRITNVTRTVDSNGRVWIRTDTAPGDPDSSGRFEVSQAPVVMVPDSELAELAARIR